MINVSEDTFLYLPYRDVLTACTHIDSVAVMRDVFRLHATGQTILPDEAYLGWENSRGEQVRNLNMPAYVGGETHQAGTKIINANIANPTRDLPRASGLTMLYDELSTRVKCVMEASYISGLRTASVSLLATELTTGEPIETVAVIGTGAIARMHIALLLQCLPELHTLYLFDLVPAHVERLQKELESTLLERHIQVRGMAQAREAVQPAQLIVAATTTTEGYIPYRWLRAGAIILNVSLDDVLPDVVMNAASVIVDDWMLVKNDTRRLLGRMYRQGQIVGPDELSSSSEQSRRIDAQLGELVIGRKQARNHNDDIILINPFGLAIEDVALAGKVYEIALAHGLGQQLPC